MVQTDHCAIGPLMSKNWLSEAYRQVLPFIKMHALGNSYIYIDRRTTPLDEFYLPILARMVSNKETGIGSDGLILIDPSEIADAKMRIFNRDGSEGKNCGNGLRCVAHYLYCRGELAAEYSGTIEVNGRQVRARIQPIRPTESLVEVDLAPPELLRMQIPMLGEDLDQPVIAEPFTLDSFHWKLTALSLGNPHAIFLADRWRSDIHLDLGPEIELDPRFPERVNVTFAEVVSSTKLRCHIWERGSGATLACGTGACASVVAAILNGYCEKEQTITVQLPGGDLRICWRMDGWITMAGEAIEIARGHYHFTCSPTEI